MNERNLSEGQWEDRKQWSLGVGQRRKTFWTRYSKTCLKWNAIVPVFFFPPVFTGFRFTKGCVLIKQSTKNMIA